MLLLKGQCFRRRLWLSVLVSQRSHPLCTYISESWQLRKPDILCSANERLLGGRKYTTFEVRGTFVAVDQDVDLAETGLAAAMEVFVGVGKLVEIGCCLGSLGIG